MQFVFDAASGVAGSGFLVHLHSLTVTMNQKSTVSYVLHPTTVLGRRRQVFQLM
jgi:hypothetical protein